MFCDSFVIHKILKNSKMSSYETYYAFKQKCNNLTAGIYVEKRKKNRHVLKICRFLS